MRRDLTRAIVAAGGLTGLGLAMQPLMADPSFRSITRSGTEALLITGFVSGIAVVAGGAVHQLLTWSRDLPPAAPALPVQYAKDAEAVRLVYEEQRDDSSDPADLWRKAVIRFAFFGNCNGWGWRDLCPYMGREDWKVCTRLLIEGGVLSPAKGKRGTDWIVGWNYPRFRMALKYGDLEMPFPTPDPAPRIEWTRTVTQWHAQHAQHAR